MSNDTGRAVALRPLNEQQQAFVTALTSDGACRGKVRDAALFAGYSPATAHEQGRRLVTLPHVKAAIFEANRDQISGPLLTRAVAVLHDILHDDTAPIKVKLEASKTVLDRGGLTAQRTPDDGSRHDRKRPEDMTMDELERFIREGSEALARSNQAMKDITPADTLENENEDD